MNIPANEKIPIQIVGDGVFGKFLRVLLAERFYINEDFAEIAVLAVSAKDYAAAAKEHGFKHLINVCSVQSLTLLDCFRATNNVTGIHPLFGPRTPSDKRFAIMTHHSGTQYEKWFLERFVPLLSGTSTMTPQEHDVLMAKTHGAFVKAAEGLKPYVDAAKYVPDELIPNSFRKLRELVDQLEDMPAGTLDSIRSNPFLK